MVYPRDPVKAVASNRVTKRELRTFGRFMVYLIVVLLCSRLHETLRRTQQHSHDGIDGIGQKPTPSVSAGIQVNGVTKT